MQPLILELLGPPRLVTPQGESLLAAGLPLALLAYLVLEDREVPREHMAGLFWPGMDRSRQLHNLRQTTLRIRNGHEEHPLLGNGTLSIRPGSLVTDVDEFLRNVAECRIAEAISLWRGPFLQGFRRPQSWELEDWVDRKRTMLEETLGTAVVSEGRRVLEAGSPEMALSLLSSPRRLLPLQEELGVLEVMALAGSGRGAEAEGLLRTLELGEGSELRREAAKALASAPKVLAPTPPSPMATDSEIQEPPSTDSASAVTPTKGLPLGRPSSLRKAFVWLIPAAAVVLFTLGLLRRHSAGATTMLAVDQAGYALLVSAGWATDGDFSQLFRMGFDGKNKHRLSEGRLGEAAWVQEAEAVFGPMPDSEGESRLFRLTPDPENPIAEWHAAIVESARNLKNPKISRANPKVGIGGILVFSAEDEEGNRDIYGLETISGELRRLTSAPGTDEWPSVRPGGDRVLFTSDRSGGGDLYSVGLDGAGLTRLTDHPLKDGVPWVRGDSVLFIRGRGTEAEDGNMELVLLNLTTGAESQLTDNAWNDYEQMWSPDGRYLCWQSERLGHYESDIIVMDLRTGSSWNAIDTPGRESDCRWAPVGNGLLYLHWGEGKHAEIFFQDPWEGDPINISRYPGPEAMIDYFPLPKGMGEPSDGDVTSN